MKLYLRNLPSFNVETLLFYRNNREFEVVFDENKADIIVINDFKEAHYPDKIVARNSTAEDGIVAKEIISLRGEDLSDLDAVANLTWAMLVYCLRIFKSC